MRRLTRIMVVALALGATSFALAGEADKLARLDEDLKALAAFDYGKDAGPLSRIEDLVFASVKDPAQREAVEQRLLRTLAGEATTAAKSFICRQLRTIGTARSVPVLEPMLADKELGHMARYALGRMDDPAAEEALRRALAKTSGPLQAGIASSLGDRASVKAVPDVAKLLGSADALVADAAASALGRTGGPAAVKALEAARTTAPERVRPAIDDAMLACAGHYLTAGQKAEAAKIYEAYNSPKMPKHIQIGALGGLVAAKGDGAVDLLVAAIRNRDAEIRTSAIGFTRTATGPAVTKALVDLLPLLGAEPQALLVGALAARGDTAGAPAIATAAKSENEGVRVAALEALGAVGDVSCVDLLAKAAAAGGAGQAVARTSLVQLRGDAAGAAIVKAMGAGEPKVRAELIRALAGRKACEAVGELLKAARDDDASVRGEAIRAVGAVVPEAGLESLVALALEPKDAGDRAAVEEAVTTAFRRMPDAEKQAAPVLAALAKAPAGARPTLVRLAGRTGTAKSLAAVLAARNDADAAVQDAAVRALAEWPDAAPADELLKLAASAASPTHKVLALRGYVRMAGQSKDPTAMYVRALNLAERTEDKKLVLAGLGTADSVEALKLVEGYLKDEALRNEAGLAVVQIAERVRATDAARAGAAVKAVLAAVTEPAVRQKAQDVVNETEKFDAHILTWQVAGPYEQEGKDAAALLDIAFPPEKADAKDVPWKPLTKGIGSWEITLDAAVGGGENRAAYMRTCVTADADQDAQLELGSDDGIVKVWLNGAVVHTNNQDRGIAPRQDLAKIKLRKGENPLMVKVVNHSGGWGFAVRIRKPDGSAIEGLKYEAK